LKANAILVTNDKDFNEIAEKGVIEVWSIAKAIEELVVTLCLLAVVNSMGS